MGNEISQQQIMDLLVEARGSDANRAKFAKEAIIKSNLRLVQSIAKKYRRSNAVAYDDLLQEGSMGILRAIDKYDPDKGTKFSTYAVIWIKQAINMWINSKKRIIRLPAHAEGVNKKINLITSATKARTGYAPTREEILTGIKDSATIIDATTRAACPIISFDAPISNDAGNHTTLGDSIAADNAIPSDFLERKEMMAIARKVYQSLSEREKLIIKMRFGIDDSE